MKDVISSKYLRGSQHYVAMFAWLFLGFMYVSLISQWLTVSRRDQMFTSYTDRVMVPTLLVSIRRPHGSLR